MRGVSAEAVVFSFERQRDQIVHQPEMDMLALRQAKWDLPRRFTHCFAHRNLDPPLNFTNVLHISVEPAPIARAKVLLERSNLIGYGIENAGVLLASGKPLLRTRPVAEQALESHTRIDFRRKGLRGRAPGNGVGVRAAITPVAVAEISAVLNPQLNG